MSSDYDYSLPLPSSLVSKNLKAWCLETAKIKAEERPFPFQKIQVGNRYCTKIILIDLILSDSQLSSTACHSENACGYWMWWGNRECVSYIWCHLQQDSRTFWKKWWFGKIENNKLVQQKIQINNKLLLVKHLFIFSLLLFLWYLLSMNFYIVTLSWKKFGRHVWVYLRQWSLSFCFFILLCSPSESL